MTTPIVPHSLFTIWRADEVAECLEGVPEHLYCRLWNDIVPKQKPLYDEHGEHITEEPVIGSDDLVSLGWDILTDEEKLALNGLAEAQDAKDRQWLADHGFDRAYDRS